MFGLFVNSWVEMPVSTLKAIPKCNRVVRAFFKRSSKSLGNRNRVQLIWVERQIKDLSYSVNSISNDNNILNIQDLNSLINSASNQEQFYLSESDTNCIIDYFS